MMDTPTILNTTTAATQNDLNTTKCLYPPRFQNGPDKAALDLVAFIILCPVLALVCILGFFGNTLSFVVMCKEKKNSSTFLMKSLAIADNLVLLFVLLFFVMPSIYDYTSQLNELYDFFMMARNYLSFGLWVFKYISIYIVVYMTAERYIAVCMPFNAVNWCTLRNACIGLAVVIITSLAYNLPKLWFYKPAVYEYDPCFGYHRPKTYPTDLYSNSVIFQNIYVFGLYFVVIFIIPLTTLIILNTFLIRTVQRAKAARDDMATSSKAKKGDNITEKIIGVVTAFILLETPGIIFNLTYLIDMNDAIANKRKIKPVVDILLRLAYVLSATNSFINFYIYCLVGDKFRRQAIDILRCASPDVNRSGSFSHTGASVPTVSSTTPVPNGNSHTNGVNGRI